MFLIYLNFYLTFPTFDKMTCIFFLWNFMGTFLSTGAVRDIYFWTTKSATSQGDYLTNRQPSFSLQAAIHPQ